LVYFDNSATSQKPRQVIEVLVDYYEKHNANVHRGVHKLSDEATEMYEGAREKVASFIGAETQEFIFVRNTTEGINLVTWAWALGHMGKGDLILTTEMEHHSNIIPWQQLCQSKGARLAFVKVNDEFLLDEKDLDDKLSKKPKLLCITHVSNVLGTINPIKEIVKKAHRAEAKVLVDGAQSMPHMPVNVKDLGCDFFAFSGHKMLGPMGIGGLYIKKEIMEGMSPFLTGGGMISEVKKNGSTFDKGVARFEAGTPNVAGAAGLAAAVEYLEKVGMKNIFQHERKLTKHTLAFLNDLNHLRIFGSKNLRKRTGVVSFSMKGVHAHDVAQVLDGEGIAVRAGHHCAMPLHQKLGVPATVRASFYLYNTKNEVNRFIKALGKVKKIFG